MSGNQGLGKKEKEKVKNKRRVCTKGVNIV
jgi:hypothetical protein